MSVDAQQVITCNKRSVYPILSHYRAVILDDDDDDDDDDE